MPTRDVHCGWTRSYYGHLVVLLCLFVLADVATSIAGPEYCLTDADKQFEIVVTTSDSLGLRLSDKLTILEFVADSEGRSRVIEASGLAEIGDHIIAVNDVLLTDLSFREALEELQTADLPKRLRFQSHDGRCLENPSNATSQNATNQTSILKQYDYVVLSIGEKETEESYYAVLSSDGQPPSCLFREFVVSSPVDACHPLTVNVTDKYVVVPSILNCPAHQKAALAQESGAKGVIFIQRYGEKPQQIRIPPNLPKPIKLSMVMVSFDSGIRMIERLASLHSSQTLQIRFVFNEECASDKYAIHPDGDPLQQSVVKRSESAASGFLSLTVAETATKMISAAAFEFLKPTTTEVDGRLNMLTQPPSAALPLGKYPLIFVPPRINACIAHLEMQASELALWVGEMENAFVAVELRDCSIVDQVEFFASLHAIGVVFVDPTFPTAATQTMTRMAAQQASIPFVLVSSTAMKTMRAYGKDVQAVHVLVEFTGENALHHQWQDLGTLLHAKNWPTSVRARERLFHRMLKDQDALEEAESELLIVNRERYDALVTAFENAQRFFETQRQEQQRPTDASPSMDHEPAVLVR